MNGKSFQVLMTFKNILNKYQQTHSLSTLRSNEGFARYTSVGQYKSSELLPALASCPSVRSNTTGWCVVDWGEMNEMHGMGWESISTELRSQSGIFEFRCGLSAWKPELRLGGPYPTPALLPRGARALFKLRRAKVAASEILKILNTLICFANISFVVLHYTVWFGEWYFYSIFFSYQLFISRSTLENTPAIINKLIVSASVTSRIFFKKLKYIKNYILFLNN